MLWLALLMQMFADPADPPAMSIDPPSAFGAYYSGPPCPEAKIDRTFGQFQVNLAEEALLHGYLISSENGEAILERNGRPPIRLVTNSSRADWLLAYPLITEEIGVWGRTILGGDCEDDDDHFYVEAIFPPSLIQGRIDPRADLMNLRGEQDLRRSVEAYRHLLGHGLPQSAKASHEEVSHSAAARLAKTLFDAEAATAPTPWRVRLFGNDEVLPASTTVEVLLSGSDGSVGVFGHIAAGGDGIVYNVYPNYSERGASGPVPLADYLFNAQRGHALRRPTWILRLEGLPPGVVETFHEDISADVLDLVEGRTPYHPTANNCTIVSLNALARLGFEVARARYFTRRFPRPAFVKILSDLPELIDSGRLDVKRVELIYVPQVPIRPNEGRAPNRPLRDRSKV